MEFVNVTVSVKFKKSFSADDLTFVGLIESAIEKSPCFLNFNIDFDYKGRVGGTGFNFLPDNLSEGNYEIYKTGDNNFSISANCSSDESFGFFTADAKDAFLTAIQNKSLQAILSCVANNGEIRSEFWSMELNIPLNLDEVQVIPS